MVTRASRSLRHSTKSGACAKESMEAGTDSRDEIADDSKRPQVVYIEPCRKMRDARLWWNRLNCSMMRLALII